MHSEQKGPTIMLELGQFTSLAPGVRHILPGGHPSLFLVLVSSLCCLCCCIAGMESQLRDRNQASAIERQSTIDRYTRRISIERATHKADKHLTGEDEHSFDHD